MWTAICLEDPVTTHLSSHNHPPAEYDDDSDSYHHHYLVHCQVSLSWLLSSGNNHEPYTNYHHAFQEGGRPACVALADFCARKIIELFHKQELVWSTTTATIMTTETTNMTTTTPTIQCALEPLEYSVVGSNSRRRRTKQSTLSGSNLTPFVLERTDVWTTIDDDDDDDDDKLHVMLRGHILTTAAANTTTDMDREEGLKLELQKAAVDILTKSLGPSTTDHHYFALDVMQHVACVVVQHRLRACLADRGAVALIADGSILPRKSGANHAPMASPPAVPCQAPPDSPMRQTLEVELGSLGQFLTSRPGSHHNTPNNKSSSSTFSVTGMVIPKGITLVAGGGYHGKSTLLRAIAAGVYDKVPGDGREFCVTVPWTTTIRAEDGRYVQNCNISAFISNLPTLPGSTSAVDTAHFSSAEASGSTSQAANVAEAMEMGAKVFLIDEDVSAANFMARDGRMRALVMDESITPLLYRVNGMYNTLGISSVVVVGGVGDWLDVPHQVILMNKYVASDATQKAQSISKTFSHGHVQYAGKGLVHQLPWEKKGTPLARKPTAAFLEQINPERSMVSLLDGGHALSIHPSYYEEEDVSRMADDATTTRTTIYNDEDDGYIDLSRCEQLVGKKPQLFACGQCVLWLIRQAKRNPEAGISDLLSQLDSTIDEKGMLQIFAENSMADDAGIATPTNSILMESSWWIHLLHVSGFAYRPRKYEIGQALYRMRGIQLEHIPVEDDGEEEAARQEALRKKRALAELWEKRRSTK